MTTKDSLDVILFSMLGSEELVGLWWSSPNKAFDNKPPCEVELSEVRKYLIWHAFCAGGS